MTYVKLSCIFVASLIAGCQTSRDAPKSVAPSWPTWATEAQPRLDGLTNTLVDFIGPIDGSAKLTIFTEGNHYPVLLPMVFDRFSEWCPKPECELKGEEVLVVTLPQRLIVEALLQKRIQLGQATLNLSTSGVWPDIVMAGRAPLTKLAEAGIIAPEASVFAKHKGLGLLVQRDAEITNLSELISSDARVVFATPWERGARAQYKKTIDALVGKGTFEKLARREIGNFSGRLKIQHRDVPYALVTGHAEVGIIFGHLAAFYAQAFRSLRYEEVPGAAPFGQAIAASKGKDAGPEAERFLSALKQWAPTAYAQAGFHRLEDFDFDARWDLKRTGLH